MCDFKDGKIDRIQAINSLYHVQMSFIKDKIFIKKFGEKNIVDVAPDIKSNFKLLDSSDKFDITLKYKDLEKTYPCYV